MKCFKKIASLFVVLCFVFTNTIVTYVSAASTAGTVANEIVKTDSYQTPYYEMATYQSNDTVYVIAALNSGEIHFATAKKGSDDVQSMWLDRDDLAAYSESSSIASNSINNAVANAVINYSVDNASKMEAAKVHMNPGVQTMAYSSRDENAILDELESTYGSEHTAYNWTGMTSQTYQGNRYNYKENLTHTIEYRDSIWFERGAYLADIVAALTAALPGVRVVTGTIAIVLNITATEYSQALDEGSIASYYSNTLYYRYVLVNNGGPYFECTKDVTNDCWILEGDSSSVQLDELATIYSTAEDIFESYTRQREIAYANYA